MRRRLDFIQRKDRIEDKKNGVLMGDNIGGNRQRDSLTPTASNTTSSGRSCRCSGSTTRSGGCFGPLGGGSNGEAVRHYLPGEGTA